MSEISPDQRHRLLASINPNSLELILLPTEKCNFRCKYCYEDFAMGRMSPVVVAGIKALIHERSADLRRLHISWFGGEPLLAKDIVLDVSHFAQHCSFERGIEYQSSMTTNGFLLTAATHTEMLAAGITQFQISLDGDEKHHDISRPLANGRGTYKTIMQNLSDILASDATFQVTLRLHITNENAEEIFAFYRTIKNGVLADPRVRLFTKVVANLGGPNLEKSILPDGDAGRRVRQEILTDYNLNLNKIEAREGDIKVCYAARPNSFVIRSNGDVGKCTVAFHSAHNAVGHIAETGSLGLNKAKLAKWMQGFRDFDKAALHCPAEKLRLF